MSIDSVQGDPLLLLKKSSKDERDLSENREVLLRTIEAHIFDSEFDERRIYSLYINECLKNGFKIIYDAKDAYIVIRNSRKEFVANGAVN